MKKEYVAPYIECVKLTISDVLVTSTSEGSAETPEPVFTTPTAGSDFF